MIRTQVQLSPEQVEALRRLSAATGRSIADLVRQGYLVRARSDADTQEARVNDTHRRDAMLNSGAQIVSTDYPASEPARWAGRYSVSLPGKAEARCNPVNAPGGCRLQ